MYSPAGGLSTKVYEPLLSIRADHPTKPLPSAVRMRCTVTREPLGTVVPST
ncbi:hypothetical protein AB0F17_02255 [Nonomuraea sp. NPDC026600]|uniref:hypothetical protein n=1 Tax=Nonomuraea sp. NPDC026600 TaxID=3155363 RepID=UPI0033D84436